MLRTSLYTDQCTLYSQNTTGRKWYAPVSSFLYSISNEVKQMMNCLILKKYILIKFTEQKIHFILILN